MGRKQAQRLEGLAQGHLGSGRVRGEPEPRIVWSWPLKYQFSLGIPPASLLPPILCMGIMWGQLCLEEASLPPPHRLPGSACQVPACLSHFSPGPLLPASRPSATPITTLPG